jgi:glycosyltransferase involved in cell wall biosynthesis
LAPSNLLAAPRQIREIVDREGYDLVHVHTPIASFVTRLALRSLPIERRPAVLYTAHGFHFHPRGSKIQNAIYLTLEKIAGRWTDYLVVMNEHDAAEAKRHRLVRPDRIRLMPGIGVDLRKYAPESVSASDRARIHSELKLGPDERYVLMLAEFIPRKRHADMLDAFARLSNKSGVHLVLAGQGALLDKMRERARSLGIADRTHFLGRRRDASTLLAEASVLVLPSDQEGLPRCILEAMSMGVPVVASRIRGNTDLLESGRGLLFEVSDVTGLAAAVDTVLSRPGDAREMAMAGQQRATAHRIDHVIQLHESLYAEALGELRSGPRAVPARPPVESSAQI